MIERLIKMQKKIKIYSNYKEKLKMAGEEKAVANGAGGLFGMLAMPGVGPALGIVSGLLGFLGGGGNEAEMQQWQADTARLENERARAAQRSNQAMQNVENSYQSGAQNQIATSQNTLSALDRFLK